MKWLRKFKSHWFYWHTGYRKIAVLSMITSAVVLWSFLGITSGFSIGAILVAVLLDTVGFWLAIVYFLLVRPYFPDWLGLQSSADTLLIKQVVIPMIVGFFLNRIASFCVAKLCGYRFDEGH